MSDSTPQKPYRKPGRRKKAPEERMASFALMVPMPKDMRDWIEERSIAERRPATEIAREAIKHFMAAMSETYRAKSEALFGAA